MRTLNPVLLIALTLAVGACSTQQPPQMARSGQLHFGVPSPDWTARLQSRFPVGTPEASVVAALRREGFRPSSRLGERTYAFDWSPGLFGFPCSYTLTARWTADTAGGVASITGDYWNACV